MKIIANRQELLAIVKKAAHIAPVKSPVALLEGIFLEGDENTGQITVIATNLEVSLSCQMKASIPFGGTMVANARLFRDMLCTLSDEMVIIEIIAEQLHLRSGSAEYNISVLPAKNYPIPEFPCPLDMVKMKCIPTLAEKTAFAVSSQVENPKMSCVNLAFTSSGMNATGCDGIRLMSTKAGGDIAGDISLLVPATSLKMLASMVTDDEVFHVGTTGNYLVFMREDFAFSARQISGQYIDTETLLHNLKPSFSVLVDGQVLYQSIRAVDTISVGGSKLHLHFNGDTLTLDASTKLGNTSTAVEITPLTGASQGDFYYVNAKLKECLRALQGSLVLNVMESGILLIHCDDTTCMFTACRKPSEIAVKQPVKRASKNPKAKVA